MLTEEYQQYLKQVLFNRYERQVNSIFANGFVSLEQAERQHYSLAKTPKGKKVYYRRYKGRK
jgi:hypothetical protein